KASAEADADLKEGSVENSLSVEVITKVNKDGGGLRGEEPEDDMGFALVSPAAMIRSSVVLACFDLFSDPEKDVSRLWM
ncbi:hypothetical protein STEG23_027057, partial [Scotinomys teguina]